MDCIRVSQNLYDYLDGEVRSFRRQAIARHLDECAACSAGFTFEVQVRQMLWEKCRDDPPAGLAERIMSALGDAALDTSRLDAGNPPESSRPTDLGTEPAGPFE